MLTVIVARERPNGNLQAMFLLLDMWKKGIRDCFVDSNLTKQVLDEYCEKLGTSYHSNERPDVDKNQSNTPPVQLPKDTVVVEAEAAHTLEDGVKVIEKEGASRGKAIDSARGKRAFHEIKLPKAGRWYVWIRAFFPDAKRDSYWIGIDGAEPHPWDQEGGPGAVKIYAGWGDSVNQQQHAWGVWYWDCGVKTSNIPNGYFEVKTPGRYRLWSKGREPGAILDQILLTMDRKFDAEGVFRGKPGPSTAEVSPFEEMPFVECQRLIRHALDIATGVKTEIPWEFTYWRDLLGDLSKAPKTGGSLYKCPKCGEDLPQTAVELIKQHAQSDDIQFYILCRKCGGEFD